LTGREIIPTGQSLLEGSADGFSWTPSSPIQELAGLLGAGADVNLDLHELTSSLRTHYK